MVFEYKVKHSIITASLKSVRLLIKKLIETIEPQRTAKISKMLNHLESCKKFDFLN